MGKDKDRKKDKKHKKEKEKHKKRRRERSSSPDSSGSDSDEHRKRQKAEKMAKKVADYWDKQSSKGAAPNKFVWMKKVERDLQAGKSIKEFTVQAEMEKHKERMSEIEKVQKRREEKEAEKARMEEELALLERQRLAAEAADQEEKEEEFHLEQALVRSDRRLAQGRPRPIDYVTQALHGLKGRRAGEDHDAMDDEEDEGTASLAAEPYRIFNGLLVEDLQELADDIKGLKELDVKDPLHAEFWSAMNVLANEELSRAARRDAEDRARQRAGGGVAGAGRVAAAAAEGGGAAAAMPSEVRREIEALLAGQTHGYLRQMEREINASLAAGEGDPDYWEAVLERLQIHAAKARLRELHADLLRRRIQKETAKIDVAEVMGWAEEEGAAAAAAAAAGAAAAASEEPEGEGADALPEAMEAEGEGAAPAAGGRAAVNEEEIPLSEEDEEEGGAPKAAAAKAGPFGPPEEEGEGGPDEEEEEAEPQRQQQQFLGIGASGGMRDMRDAAALAESDGRYSPPPVDLATVDHGVAVVAEEDDARALALLRQEVKLKEASRYLAASEAAAKQMASQAADRAYQRQFASRSLAPVHPMLRNVSVPDAPGEAGGSAIRIGMGPVARQEEDPELRRLRLLAEKAMSGAAGDDEEAGAQPGMDLPFGGEVGLGVASQAYWWHNKYAPRKPKYFNRIHTGYEWNKYNQTHYDTDNPPPKVVQGYKFNIFYPDLIDKKTAPTYRVDPDPSGSKDTCILVFTAGPPYEDIAFRIVNKEWETTHRRGFKCTYDRGILHLYFNFKRARYRR